jgi:transposase
VTAELERIRDVEGVDLVEDVMPLLSICESTRKHLEVSDRRLNKLAQRHPICGQFMQIPGVGFLTALSVYSAIEDPARFVRNEDAGAYFGLVPRVRQSGQSLQRLGISKMGNGMTRGHLITAAGVLMRLNNADCDLQDWAKALAARADSRRARAALARKLAVTMLSMWKSGKSFKARALAGVPDS